MRFLLAQENLNFILLAGIGLGVLTLLALVIAFVLSIRSSQLHHKQIKKNSTTLRVFRIDAKNDKVLYFNRSDLKHKKQISMTEFYNLFPESDRERLIEWVAELLDEEKDAPHYIELNILGHSHHRYFAFLQVQSIDRKEQLIHVDSYLLKYMSAARVFGFDAKHFLNKETFAKTLINSGIIKGITADINFFSKISNNDNISRLLFSQLMNVLTPYITTYRPMLAYDDHQIIVSDLKAFTKQKSIQVLNTLKNDINKFLLLNGLETEIGYTIGVVENKYFQDDIEGLFENCVKLAKIAHDDKEDILFYEEGYRFDETRDAEHYRTEVEKIIQDKKLRYLYRPIYDVSRKMCVGYQSFVEPLDSFFENVDELKKYAVRTEDDRELFATIAKNTITRFIEEKDGVGLRLYFPITLGELDYVNRIFSYISHIKDTHIVLILEEYEVSAIVENASEALINNIRNIKSKGYQIALKLEDSDLTLSPLVYEIFDFFMISTKSHITKKTQTRQLPTFQGMIEKLLKYRKDIIAVDIPSWEYVELVIKLGIAIVSSDAIAPKDENVLPLPKKSIIKLENID